MLSVLGASVSSISSVSQSVSQSVQSRSPLLGGSVQFSPESAPSAGSISQSASSAQSCCLLGHHVITTCSPRAHHVLTTCSPCAHHVLTTCSPRAHHVLTMRAQAPPKEMRKSPQNVIYKMKIPYVSRRSKTTGQK